ncbi:MAG: DNA mismatch repair endonuclease MutL [Spirochaetales bacterium]
MGKINILDSSVFTKIAAGEVVERPASVVKELVENSIDAGATQIKIEIEMGGKQKIKVSDNGCGIANDEVQTALLPHATSKIKFIEDLEKIGTLGFRGEALSSIVSVSKVEMLTKTSESSNGQLLKCEGGKVIENKPYASKDGTFITVNDLFYNIPARQKFLKTDKREEAEITNLVARFILANPQINFTYMVDDKEVYRSTGKNLEEAVYTVYGKSTLENLVPFETMSGNIKLWGYLGKPNFSKNNRTYQTLIINGRYVINSTVSSAVYSAYENYLMKGKFPFFIINMQMPLDILDVNVHPNKLDVKFEDGQHIFGLIYNAVKNGLMQANNVMKVENTHINKQIDMPLNEYKKEEGISFKLTANSAPKEVILFSQKSESEIAEEKAKILNSFLSVAGTNSGAKGEGVLRENSSVLTSALHNTLNSVNVMPNQESVFKEQGYKNLDIIYVGKVFNTFLLLQKESSLFIIDQHAAHERLLYDKFTEQVNANSIMTQALLVPHIITVNHLEEVFLLENLHSINELGFEVESFGKVSFKINAVPAILSGINIDLFFNEILKDINFLTKNKASDLIKEHLMQASCKAAIKGGDNLNDLEIKTLFEKIEKSGMTLLCPHGRPVVVEVTRKELDKWFKRVL